MNKVLETLERIALGSSTLESQTPKFQEDYKLVKKELKDKATFEEEFGIDLSTFSKLLKTTKAWTYSNNGKVEVSLTGLDPYDKTVNLWNGTCHTEYPLSEYGKSFALTKEELL